MIPTIPSLLTVAEVAEHLRCCPKHVYHLVQRGKLTCFRDGKKFIFKFEDVALYLNRVRVNGGSAQ